MTKLNNNINRIEVHSTQTRAIKTARSNKLLGPSNGDVSMVNAEPIPDPASNLQ